jgi:hypothetical protein
LEPILLLKENLLGVRVEKGIGEKKSSLNCFAESKDEGGSVGQWWQRQLLQHGKMCATRS